MPTEHYFSSDPGTPFTLREVQVELDGETVTLTTAPGIFSPARIDKGTQILLSRVPSPPRTGNLLDIGCGWGPLALTMARRSPEATVWAIDVNHRSLELLRLNAARLGLENVKAVLPEEVPAEVTFDAIWSNPPIRVGKETLHRILRTWLPRLTEDGDAWLVVQKNLGADSLQRWISEELPERIVERVSTDKGFRVITVS